MDWPARFLSRVRTEPDGCWLWTGYVTATGYGRVAVPGRRKLYAHRVSYELHVGPIPVGLTLDHLCRNKLCVRPDHLEPVTLAENIRRAWPRRTHCPYGHSLADAYVDRSARGSQRKCRTCHLSRVRARHARRRAAQRLDDS